jgi:DNA-binding PadR family transcriptional regulator
MKRYDIAISPGIIYSTLYSLEREGLIIAKQRNKSRRYSISPRGENLLRNISLTHHHIQVFTISILESLSPSSNTIPLENTPQSLKT